MTRKKIKAAIIGCGRMGCFTNELLKNSLPKGLIPLSHAEAIEKMDDIELIALCDTNMENLKKAQDMYNVKEIFTDYKEMIKRIKPDIVTIATRTKGRTDIISYAAKNGVLGIHIEKPISTNLNSCIKALEDVNRYNVKISYGTIRRFSEIFIKAKEIIKSGELGKIIQISIENGKTNLLWSHPHSVDTILFFSEEIKVEYVQSTCIFEKDSIKNNLIDCDPKIEFGFIKFKNGINGLISSADGLNTVISGTQGNLILSADGMSMEIRKKKSDESPYFIDLSKEEENPKISATQNAIEKLVDSIKDNGKSPISTEEIILGQKILFSLVKSSLDSGKRIGIEELDKDFTVSGRFNDLYP